MSDREALVEVHGVGDGVEALEGDDGEGEDGQLAGEHPQEARHQAPRRRLPLDRVLLKLTWEKVNKIVLILYSK